MSTVSTSSNTGREITPIEYAKRTGLSLPWVYILLRMEKIPAVKVGREWRIAVQGEGDGR